MVIERAVLKILLLIKSPSSVPVPFLPVPPQIMPFTFGDTPINTGETIGVQCMVNKGDIPINITWYLNGDRLINNDNFVTISRLNSRTSSLNIDVLNDRHRGRYKCLAKNDAGQVEYETPLFINGTIGDDEFLI